MALRRGGLRLALRGRLILVRSRRASVFMGEGDGYGDGDEEGREEGEEVARVDVLGLGERRGGPEEQHGSGDSQFSDDEGVTRLPAMTILEMGDMSPHMVLAPSIEA